MIPTEIHDLGRGDTLELITCGTCYCTVLPKYWEQHLGWHERAASA